MASLTKAELLHYPGLDLTEKAYVAHCEDEPKITARPAAARPTTLGLPARIDIARFTGRDRVERVMHYLRAHFPRAESWSEESLRELALSLIATVEIAE